MFWENEVSTVSKNIKILQIWVKSFKNTWRSAFLVKLQALNLQLCQIINSTINIFQLKNLWRTTAHQRKLQKKSTNFEIQCILCYFRRMLLCSSFSAVTAGTFNWPIIDLLQNKEELLEWTVHTFKCDQ